MSDKRASVRRVRAWWVALVAAGSGLVFTVAVGVLAFITREAGGPVPRDHAPIPQPAEPVDAPQIAPDDVADDTGAVAYVTRDGGVGGARDGGMVAAVEGDAGVPVVVLPPAPAPPAIDDATVLAVMRTVADPLRACFDDARTRDPACASQALLKVSIATLEGELVVASAEVARSPSPFFDRCAVAAVSAAALAVETPTTADVTRRVAVEWKSTGGLNLTVAAD